MTELAIRTSGHLTVSADQTFWTDDQALVLQQTGIDKDVTRAELTGFLHLAQRTGLDPFSRQIYLIGRWDARAGRKVYTPQTGIDGYRIVAQRTAERTGAPLSYDDVLWCGEDGAWRDVWLSAEPPRAAKVSVYRGSSRFSAVALYGEYVQTKKGGEPTSMWARMPAVMLAKCAESLALRKAFPHDLAGVYTTEEMAQADNPRPVADDFGRRLADRRGPGVVEDEWTAPAEVVAAQQDVAAEDVEPLMVTASQNRMMHAIFNKANVRSRSRRLEIVAAMVGRPLVSSSELTRVEASTVIDQLNDGALSQILAAMEQVDVDAENRDVVEVLELLIDGAQTETAFEEVRADVLREHAEGAIGGEQLAALQARWTDRRNAALTGVSS